MTDEQRSFLAEVTTAARKAGHIFPEAAAAEAALESAWGKSLLAVQDNNLFGMKYHRSAAYGTHVLPTKEFENGEWVVVDARWMHYPDWASCFADRMATLLRLSSVFPHYLAALDAKDADTYLREVSKTWSTDPERGTKCIAILHSFSSESHGGNEETSLN